MFPRRLSRPAKYCDLERGDCESSAGLQPAVSQNCILRTVRQPGAPASLRRSAGCKPATAGYKPAIQQVANLRYFCNSRATPKPRSPRWPSRATDKVGGALASTPA